MMTPALSKLLRISSEATAALKPDTAQMAGFLQQWRTVGKKLQRLLPGRNGFWSYESSLLVRPFASTVPPLGVLEWNEKQLWKGCYTCDLDHTLFFSEDAFGCQYCLADDKVKLFDPETGQLENVADSLDGWAQVVI